MKIGVLALQGAFIEHLPVLEGLGVDAPAIRLPGELKGLDGLIIPGGESTSILNLMQSYKLFEPIKDRALHGFPILGTCAGLICLARNVHHSGRNGLETLSLMDIEVERNAFGRQVDSFETDLQVPVLGEEAFHAIFIRAPIIQRTGEQVEVLDKLSEGTVVAARQGKLVVTAFHPELSDDTRFHSYFLKIASD